MILRSRELSMAATWEERKGGVEYLLQELGLRGYHHPEHGLEGGQPHPGARAGGVDL